MKKDLRDFLMFGIGALGFFHEVFFGAIERKYVIGASLALMGAPFILSGGITVIKNGQNRRRNGGNGESS